ncbi:MAG: c-type cytochrome [Magnetococcales bacterium]|nr:c-type cytochrome [Magnetococcales bacterium]
MKKIGLTVIAALFATSFAVSSSFAGEGDAAKGAKFTNKKCTICHSFGDKFKKKGKVGPSLEAGVLGQKAGAVDGFKYSKGMKKAAEAGLVWNEANLDEFLTKPKKFIKGTKMSSFPGIKKAANRANVIAFLKTL